MRSQRGFWLNLGIVLIIAVVIATAAKSGLYHSNASSGSQLAAADSKTFSTLSIYGIKLGMSRSWVERQLGKPTFDDPKAQPWIMYAEPGVKPKFSGDREITIWYDSDEHVKEVAGDRIERNDKVLLTTLVSKDAVLKELGEPSYIGYHDDSLPRPAYRYDSLHLTAWMDYHRPIITEYALEYQSILTKGTPPQQN
jgi:hypothetical protein